MYCYLTSVDADDIKVSQVHCAMCTVSFPPSDESTQAAFLLLLVATEVLLFYCISHGHRMWHVAWRGIGGSVSYS
jgi:hypothetical protein